MKLKVNAISRSGILISSAILLAACSGSKTSDKPVLAVSIAPEKYVLEQLVDTSRFDIVTLMPGGNNPETYEPGISARKAIDDALIYFHTGLFPFENSLTVAIDGKTNVVSVSKDIDFIYGTHLHSDGHDAFLHSDTVKAPDPHIWTSVDNVRRIASNMTEALIQADPADSAAYVSRLGVLNTRLDSIDTAIRSRLSDKAGTAFLVWHPSLSYFAREYGLNQIAVGSESKEISPKILRQLIDSARTVNVKTFFFQKEFDTRQAESINTGVGSELVIINPASADLEGQLEIITSALEK